MFKHILFVCTGNICRSPTAEAILRVRLRDQGVLKGRVVESAGTMGVVGEAADPLTFEVALERGVDLSDHRARQATPLLLEKADLILTLDRSHEAWIARRLPHLRGRVHLLGRWQNNRDVEDPYGLPRAKSVEAFELIDELLDDWLPRIVDK